MNMKPQTETTPRLMTRDYAVREGFIAPVDGIAAERKFPYIRITLWYSPEEHWMARNAADALTGCDFILIVDETCQAVFRAVNQTQIDGE